MATFSETERKEIAKFIDSTGGDTWGGASWSDSEAFVQLMNHAKWLNEEAHFFQSASYTLQMNVVEMVNRMLSVADRIIRAGNEDVRVSQVAGIRDGAEALARYLGSRAWLKDTSGGEQ